MITYAMMSSYVHSKNHDIKKGRVTTKTEKGKKEKEWSAKYVCNVRYDDTVFSLV